MIKYILGFDRKSYMSNNLDILTYGYISDIINTLRVTQ